MKKIILLGALAMSLLACNKTNPLLDQPNTPYGVPAFDKVKLEHYLPAFEEANNIKIPYVICPRRPGDVDENYANCEKAYKEMGFKTELDIVDACRDSWHWQKNNPNGYGD